MCACKYETDSLCVCERVRDGWCVYVSVSVREINGVCVQECVYVSVCTQV